MNTKNPSVDPTTAATKFLEDERYAKFSRSWSSNDLAMIINDPSKALEYARKGIEVNEPEKLSDDYINQIAEGLQQLAKKILEKRGK